MSKNGINSTHSIFSNNIENQEEEWFSYQKCNEEHEHLLNKYDEEKDVNKLVKILIYLIEVECVTNDDQIMRGVYDFFFPSEFSREYTKNEKLFIQLRFLSSVLREFKNMDGYKYDDGDLGYVIKRFSQLSNLCTFEEINYNIFPFEVKV